MLKVTNDSGGCRSCLAVSFWSLTMEEGVAQGFQLWGNWNTCVCVCVCGVGWCLKERDEEGVIHVSAKGCSELGSVLASSLWRCRGRC